MPSSVLPVAAVHLDHHAVDLVRRARRARSSSSAWNASASSMPVAARARRVSTWKPQPRSAVEHRRCWVASATRSAAHDLVGEEVEPARRGDRSGRAGAPCRPRRCARSRTAPRPASIRRLLSASNSGSGISASPRTAIVPRAPARPPRRASRSGMRADRAQVLGDVLAGLAVAARRAAHEHAVLVDQLDREPVELGLGHVGRRVSTSSPLRTRSSNSRTSSPSMSESSESIGRDVRHLLEARSRRPPPDALRGRVGRRAGRGTPPRASCSSRKSRSYAASEMVGLSST